MASIDRTQKTIKELFIGHCWEYLNQNFHKFNETNRIKIALELCKKDVPQEFKGNLSITQMGLIKKDEQPLEVNVGVGATDNTRPAGQADTDIDGDKQV